MLSNLDIAKSIITDKIDSQRKYWPNMAEPVVEYEQMGDYVFAVFHSSLNNGMHRYGMYCVLGFTLIYSDSNAVDDTHFRTLEDVKNQTKSYFKHHLNKLTNDNTR